MDVVGQVIGQVVGPRETNLRGPAKCIKPARCGRKETEIWLEVREEGAVISGGQRGTEGGSETWITTVSGDENERDKQAGVVTGREEIAAREIDEEARIARFLSIILGRGARLKAGYDSASG